MADYAFDGVLAARPPAPGFDRSTTARLAGGDAYYFFRGRSALYQLLKAWGVRPGEEVIVQAFTCLAVVAPILALGARPVFVDPAADRLSPSAASVRARVSERTRAIVVQHSFGIPADVATLTASLPAGICVIEDCAHTVASTLRGRPLGTFGHAAIYSFEWGKALIGGVGGAALVNDDGLAAGLEAGMASLQPTSWKERGVLGLEFLAFRGFFGTGAYWTLRDAFRWLTAHGLIVGSFRAEELQGGASPDYSKQIDPATRRRLARAARGLEADLARRQELAAAYAAGLHALGLPTPPDVPEAATVFLKYPTVVGNKPSLLEAARARHVELYDMFDTPIHPLPPRALAAAGYQSGSCPTAERLAGSVVSLPLHDRVRPDGVRRTMEFLQRFARPASA